MDLYIEWHGTIRYIVEKCLIKRVEECARRMSEDPEYWIEEIDKLLKNKEYKEFIDITTPVTTKEWVKTIGQIIEKGKKLL